MAYKAKKVLLEDMISRLSAVADRAEAAVARLETLSPPAPFPTDPAAQKLADEYIEQRRFELLGEDAPFE